MCIRDRYGMGLLKGARTKSANIVGSTMHLNPHGDAAIYDKMCIRDRPWRTLLRGRKCRSARQQRSGGPYGAGRGWSG